MYYILKAPGSVIVKSKGIWCVSAQDRRRDRWEYSIAILDYSDWSIQTIHLDSFMLDILGEELSEGDFINLKSMDKFRYLITYGYLFSHERLYFNAKDIKFWMFNNTLCIELSGDRYLCLGRHGVSDSLVVNFKETLEFMQGVDVTGVSDLVPWQNGYSFQLGHSFRFYLALDRFRVSKTGQCFQYISKGELARYLMMRIE